MTKLNFTIREMRTADVPGALNAIKQAGIWNGFLTPERFRKMLVHNRDYYLVAEAGGEIIGTICGMCDSAYIAYIYKLAVLPEYQGEGVGTALHARLTQIFNERGIYRVIAWIQDANFASQRSFAKSGITRQPGAVYSRKLWKGH